MSRVNEPLSPQLMAMAHQLAERHRIPESPHIHPRVFVPDRDGGVDEFMTAKLREPHYVPYCLVGIDCARTRRYPWGFECPRCGNRMNWDLTHYNGNINVKYDGPPPVLGIKEWNEALAAKKQAKAQNRLNRYTK